MDANGISVSKMVWCTYMRFWYMMMGIGPSDSRIGGTVAIIPGGGVPYIIRQQGSSWVLVGESYIHGLMDGEAVIAGCRGLVQQGLLDFC